MSTTERCGSLERCVYAVGTEWWCRVPRVTGRYMVGMVGGAPGWVYSTRYSIARPAVPRPTVPDLALA